MSDKKFYIAGMGMVTSLGHSALTTYAAVSAGKSAYQSSSFFRENGQPLKAAFIPNCLFDLIEANIDEGVRFNEQQDHIIKMAIHALKEACISLTSRSPIPLLLAMHDSLRDLDGLPSLQLSLAENCASIVSPALIRSFHSGRAAAFEAIDFAFNYLFNADYDYLLIGGSDSYADSSALLQLERAKRLCDVGDSDGFVPGEAAGFLLLTKHEKLALHSNGQVIAVSLPGIAEEPGFLLANEEYRGEGLDKAFKQALKNSEPNQISSIYSSMNGEHYWAKEIGVAQLRNKKFLAEKIAIEHPADCFGDIGAATGPVLIGLAAIDLWNESKRWSSLVYSSSDTSKRGAVVLKKYNAIEEYPEGGQLCHK